jgi:hypothetical protein
MLVPEQPIEGLHESNSTIPTEERKQIRGIFTAIIKRTSDFIQDEQNYNADTKQVNPIYRLVLAEIVKYYLKDIRPEIDTDPVIGIEDFDIDKL